MPSDLTQDYRPQRVRECYFQDQERGEQNDGGPAHDPDTKWALDDDFSISNKCKLLKINTIKMNKDPASLSDIRILALNDIYIFHTDVEMSVTKYFGSVKHAKIMSNFDFGTYRPQCAIKL